MLKSSVIFHVKRLSTMTGSFLLMLFVVMPWYYGNMAVYIWSYMVIRVGITSQINTPWIVSTFLIGWSVGLIIAGRMSNIFGKRLTLFCGILIFNGGLFASYATVQTSVSTIIITLGLELGIGCGFINGMAVDYATDWAGEYVGFVTGIVQSAMCAGAAILNEIVTVFTNPNNHPANLQYGEFSFLAEDDVLDRVTWMLLKAGFISTGVHILGFVLVRGNPAKNKTKIIQDEQSKRYASTDVKDGIKDGLPEETELQKHNTVAIDNGESADTLKENNLEKEVKVLDVIRTKIFISLWLTFFCGDYSFLIIGTYYKTFGQIWIKDDHFLTLVGTIMLIVSIAVRFVFGFFTDKVGVKNALLCIYALTTPIAVFLYLTPIVNKALFLVAVVVFGSIIGLIYPTYAVGVIVLYGEKNFSFYFGLLMTSSVVLNLIAPFVVEAILTQSTWLTLYITMAGLNIAAFFIVMSCLPTRM